MQGCCAHNMKPPGFPTKRENMEKLTTGSLFSGIGGLEYGLERTGGFRTIWNCEIEAYPSAVLKKHWPDVPNLGDITKVDWSKVAPPDIICGGFPCQDISVAGKGRGIKEGTRSGLWLEYAKAIRELRPKYAVIENVAALTRRGLHIVLADLAEAGYDAEWHNISASAVGAWHRRERIFILAYPQRDELGAQVRRGSSQADGIPELDRKTNSPTREPCGTGGIRTSDQGHEIPNSQESATPGRKRLEGNDKNACERGATDGSGGNEDDGGEDVPDSNHDGTHRQERTEERRGRMQAQPGNGGSDVPDPSYPGAGMEEHRGGGQERKSAGTSQPEILRQEHRTGGAERTDADCENVPNTDDTGSGAQGNGNILNRETDDQGRDELSQHRPGRCCENISDPESQRVQGDGSIGKQVARIQIAEGILGRHRARNRAEIWAAEPNVGRVADGVPSRVDRIKCLGNAVVPQVAEILGKMILEMEK